MSYLVEAGAAHAAGQYDVALLKLNALLEAGEASEPVSALLADCLHRLGHLQAAAETHLVAAAQAPETAGDHYRKAAFLYECLGMDEDALYAALKARQRIEDDHALTLMLVGLLMRAGETGLAQLIKESLIASDRIADLNLAVSLIGIDRSDPLSLDLFARLHRLAPERPDYLVALKMLAREFCDFERLDAIDSIVPPEVWCLRSALVGAETPLDHLFWCGDEAANRRAGVPAEPLLMTPERRLRFRDHVMPERLRIGYLSADFVSTHVTMQLMRDVLRRHDPAAVSVTLFCHTPPALARADAAARREFGVIVPVGDLDDAAAAEVIRRHGIDILVDLKGHTAHARPGILNAGAAPIQAGWLGFPGSAVGIDLDYIIADPVVAPASAAPHYHEKFCRLPETYQPNDPAGRPSGRPLTRAALGLPEDAFLFASFNHPRKITGAMVAVWSRILHRVPRSKLWILTENRRMAGNIAARFAALGIGPERLIFAAPLPREEHFARLSLADLMLDTSPCNGHTTTADALWCGVPVLTLRGSNFASRVAESLVWAAGLPDLVAEDAADYVERAVALASEPARCRRLSRRLLAERHRLPLFDSARFTRHLEGGYRAMAARFRAGLAPDHIDVEPIGLEEALALVLRDSAAA